MSAVQWDVPFTNLTAGPELRECFVKCQLPQRGLKVDEVALENPDAEILATWPVEVTHSHHTPSLWWHSLLRQGEIICSDSSTT